MCNTYIIKYDKLLLNLSYNYTIENRNIFEYLVRKAEKIVFDVESKQIIFLIIQ